MQWDDGALPPSPPASSPPPEEDGRPGLEGAARRPRISLCAVMRSISQMEAPENVGEPLGGEVSTEGGGGTVRLHVGDGGRGGTVRSSVSFWSPPRSHRCPKAARGWGTRGACGRPPQDHGAGPGRAVWCARTAWMQTASPRRSPALRIARSPARPAPRSPQRGASGRAPHATALRGAARGSRAPSARPPPHLTALPLSPARYC